MPGNLGIGVGLGSVPTSRRATVVGGDQDAPAAPTGVNALAGGASVTLSWTDPADLDLAGVRVYRSTTSGSGYGLLDEVAPGVETYVDPDLVNGTTYYYILRAVDEVPNLSAASTEVSATPQDTVAPPAFNFSLATNSQYLPLI